MNQLELISYISKRYPGALLETSGGSAETWSIEVRYAGQHFVLHLSPQTALVARTIAPGEIPAPFVQLTDLEMAQKFIDQELGKAATTFSPVELNHLVLEETKDWAKIFPRPAPVIVEIGGGGGRTIINMALSRPEFNYVGIEQAGDYYRVMHERVLKRMMPNLRTARLDAAYLIHRCFPDSSIREYHVYFPDPWPKKRHRKRRLFSEEFCADIARTLEPTGVLYVATDFEEYYIEDMLPRLRAALDVQEHPQVWEDAPEGRTNYEVKYLKEGRPIFRLVARRKAARNS